MALFKMNEPCPKTLNQGRTSWRSENELVYVKNFEITIVITQVSSGPFM